MSSVHLDTSVGIDPRQVRERADHTLLLIIFVLYTLPSDHGTHPNDSSPDLILITWVGKDGTGHLVTTLDTIFCEISTFILRIYRYLPELESVSLFIATSMYGFYSRWISIKVVAETLL